MDVRRRNKEIGRRLAKFRKKLKLTQRELGEILGKLTTSVSNWEIGRASIPMESLIIMMDKLDLNPIWLIQGRGPMFLSEVYKAKVEEVKPNAEKLLSTLLSEPWIRELIELYVKGAEYHASVAHKLRKLLERVDDKEEEQT